MARLRFPGRPGHRFDRLSLKYFADDIKNSQDPALAFLPQFQRGLKLFTEIVGLSDEEEEFEGFTFEELEDGKKKLNLFHKEEKKKAKQLAEAEEARKCEATRLESDAQISALPVERTKGKLKTTLQKSCKDLLKVKVDLGKTQDVLQNEYPLYPEIRKVKIKGAKVFDHRKKTRKFKLDYKHGFPDTDIPGGKANKSDMDMAKFLLEKARQANLLQEQARARRLSAGKGTLQKKAFVLPTQSSRSSRVIKPNKRFLEDDSVHSIVKKKSKAEELSESTPEKLERKKSLDSLSLSFSENQTIGLLDQPLIVDGKRDRKPSLKLQLSDEEIPMFSPTKSTMTSPLAAPKLGTSLFAQSQFQKASEKQKFSMMGFGSSRLHGASIVQKAKLQLNRAALNKSKAALARSLKAEMKREANFAEQAKLYDGDTSPPVPSDPQSTVKGSEKPKKKKCAVCDKKTDLTICHEKIIACLSCRRFYRECNWHINAGIFTKPTCVKSEKCKLIADRIKCRYCRIKKILDVGFPPIPELTALFADKNKEKKVKTKEPSDREVENVTSPVRKGAKKPGSLTSPVPVPGLQPAFITPPPTSAEDSPTKEQELSPVKAGEGSEKRRRKKRAFKELLRNKQEKVEEKVEEKGPVIPEKPAMPEMSPVVATGSVEISPRGGPGPRIKHVCRNAAVVLGQPLATFPEKSELRLSALPTKDKVQLWKKEEESKAGKGDSDDDRSMEEIIQQSGDSVVIVKKSPSKSKTSKKLTGAGGLHLYKRKMRCRKCAGCTRQDCGKCRHCLDMKKFGGPGTIKKACVDKPKFGGPGVLKQGCVERRCSNPLIQRSATEAFIEEKKKTTAEPKDEQDNTDDDRLEEEMELAEGETDFTSGGQEPAIPGTEVTRAVSGLVTQTGTLLEDETKVNQKENGVTSKQENLPAVQGMETRERAAARGQGSEVRKLTFEEIPNFQLERISSRNKGAGKMSSKLMKKLDMQEKYSKRGGNDGQCYPVTLQSVLPASRQWGSLLSQPKYYPIKVDFKGKQDINSTWNYGMALTMSTAMSVRTLCFLCGSSGKHEMIYCNICCEPFHEFCLEDWERPAPEHYDDWICAACQFCNVCGRQNNLLQCDKCQNTYHPGCLGPNYPTKPSKRKKIWICTKCVKCKSCGATTPGSHSQATWTYDFSLCFECGQLMDKGNFCPICRKCYSDDDWESKMIQCNKCESWVHSKCEGLTDEMYEILSYLPEDLSFYCRKCFPVGCPEWESTLKRELRLGLESILQALILSKSSQFILKYDKKKSPPKNSVESNSRTETCTPNSACTRLDMPSRTHTLEGADRHVNKFQTIKQLLDQKVENVSEVKLDQVKVGEYSTSIDNKLSQVVTNLSENKNCDLTSTNRPISMEIQPSSNTSLKTGSECSETAERAINVIPKMKDENNETKHCCDTDIKTLDRKGGNAVNSVECNVAENQPAVCDNGSRIVKHCIQSRGKCDQSSDNLGCHGNVTTDKTRKCDSECAGERRQPCTNATVDQHVNRAEYVRKDENNIHIKNVDANTQGLQNQSCDASVNKAKDTKSTDMASQVSHVIVARRTQHVQFSVEETKDTKHLQKLQIPETDSPKDLMDITEKMKNGDYKSVAVFCEDILRIIQIYLDDGEEMRVSRKKATQSVKSMFVKQLERIFPWFNVKTCRHWYSRSSLPDGMLPDATLPPSTDHTYAQWLERIEPPRSPQPSPFKKRIATPVKKYVPFDDDDYDLGALFEGDDERKCMFCHTFDDQEANDGGRLLYCGQDDWCHVNCALWSAEVYEDSDGELRNIVEAFSRGKMLKCDLCGRTGATVGCHTKGCKSNYHFMCARKDQCRFQEDKKVFCRSHRMLIDGELMHPERYSVLRRTYVGALNVRSVKKRWAKGLHCGDINILIGSCCVEGLGRLTDLSDRSKYLQPVDFISTRMYWSTKDARRRCVYTCRIVEVRPEALKSPTITIKDTRIVHDSTHPEFLPLAQLNLCGINSVTEEQSVSICEKDSCVDLTADTADIEETLSATESIMDTSCERSQLSELTVSQQQYDTKVVTTKENCQRRASFSGVSSKHATSTDKLSISWPRSNTKSVAETPVSGLSFLSPKTLKMLNIKDPNAYIKPVQNEKTDDDDCSLLKVADRLNRAAAKCSRKSDEISSPLVARSAGNSPLPFRSQSRSPSVERGFSTMLTRPISPVSYGRHTAPLHHLPTIYSQSKFSITSLPEKPFSPPSRMLSRAKSLSVEKESLLSKLPSAPKQAATTEAFLPTDQALSSPAIRRGRAFSDPIETSCMPKPLSYSSPVPNKPEITTIESKKLVLSDISTDTEVNTDVSFVQDSVDSAKTDCQITETEQVTMETESAGQSQASESVQETTMTSNKESELDSAETERQVIGTLTEKDNVHASQETDIEEIDETTETILVMTESGESLSEEEAIKLVQEMIEKQKLSEETETTVQDTSREGRQTDLDEEEENHNKGDNENEKQNFDAYTSCRSSDCVSQNNEDRNSPFIPQFEAEKTDSHRVRRYTDDTKNAQENSLLCRDTLEATALESTTNCVGVLNKNANDKTGADGVADCNDTETRVILINTSSDTDSENDVMDITDSVVNSISVDPKSDFNENATTDTKQDSPENDTDEKVMKRIVYDIDESIDSDIEILDLKSVVDESNSTDASSNDPSVKILPELVTNCNESENVEDRSILNASSVNEDEIDGDNSKKNVHHFRRTNSKTLDTISKGFGDVFENRKTESLILKGSAEIVESHTLQTDSDKVEEKLKTSTEDDEECEVIPDLNEDTTESIDREHDSSKEDVLRGLGLGTCDEVEKLKNSPKKSLSIPVLTPQKSPPYPLINRVGKRKCPKLSPIKSYPLRHTIASKKNHKDVCEDSKAPNIGDWPLENDDLHRLEEEFCKDMSPELPVLDPLAKKIKEESIAKSCAEEKGPFKCSMCRRLYRTETSYLVHVENCNFLVSSSDDEDGNDEDDGKKNKELRRTRSRRKSSHGEKRRKIEEIDKSEDCTENNKRSSLRRSTQFQRVAIEVAEKQQLEEEHTKRGRGRSSLKSKDNLEFDKDQHQTELYSHVTVCNKTFDSLSADIQDLMVKKGRGRPRKSEITCNNVDGEFEYMEEADDKLSARETRRKSREAKILDNLSQSSDSEADEKQNIVTKRKRGRPKKSDGKDADHEVNDIEPPMTKRKMRVCESTVDGSITENPLIEIQNDSDIQALTNKLKMQIERLRRSRYRPSKMVYMKTRNKNIRIYVRDRKRQKSGDKKNNFRLKAVSVRLHKTDCIDKEEIGLKDKKGENIALTEAANTADIGERIHLSKQEQIDCDETLNAGQSKRSMGQENTDGNEGLDQCLDEKESSEEGNNILDESTGWIMEKKTRKIIWSPTEKKADDFKPEESDSDVEELILDDQSREKLLDENCEGLTGEIEKDTKNVDVKDNKEPNTPELQKAVCAEEEGTLNSQTKLKSSLNLEMAGTDKNRSINNENQVENLKNRIDQNLPNDHTSNEEMQCQTDNTEVKATTEHGAISSMELKDSTDSLPQTVLKLLKDGHKVVIRNPKLNKCFMWQKTENGYIGKPFNKNLANSPVAEQTQDKNLKGEKSNNNTMNTSSECRDSSVQQLTASKILKERMRLQKEQKQEKPVSVTSTVSQFRSALTEKPEIQNRKAKFVLENIERLIESNKKAKAKAMVPTQLPKGSAEYVGGILISTPKSVSVDVVKETIKSTAPMASNMLQNSLRQKQLLNMSASNVQNIQNIQSSTSIATPVQSSIADARHPDYPTLHQQLQHSSREAVLQNVPHNPIPQFTAVTLQNMVQTGYSNISMTGLQSVSPVGSQYNPQIMNQSLQQLPVQQVQIPHMSSMDIGLINLPVMTSVNLTGQSLVQPVATGNMNLPHSLINSLSPHSFGVNASIQQPLLTVQQSILNQYAAQSLQVPQMTLNTLQSQQSFSLHSATPQTSQTLKSQIIYQNQSGHSVTKSSHGNIPHTVLNSAVSQSHSLPLSRPVYNQTQIVGTLSDKKINRHVQDIDIDPEKAKSGTSPKVNKIEAKNPEELFTVVPGLGGGSNNLLEKMKTYMASIAKSNQRPAAQKSIKPRIVVVNETNGVIKTKKIVDCVQKSIVKPDLRKKQHLSSPKSKGKKGKGEKSPRKWIKRPYNKTKLSTKLPARIAVPHKADKASHPMIHGQKEATSLPVAAVEEEVRDVPLSAHEEGDGGQGLDRAGHNLGHLEYEITSDDGFSCRSESLDNAWKQVTEKVQDARTASRLKNLSYAGLSGLQMFGLSHPNVVYLIEQLYGASYCRRYTFKYHRHEMVERELELVNPSGCIRTEPYSGRNPTDMFSFLMSRYRMLPEYCNRDINEEIAMKSSRRATSMDLPMAMRFRKLKGFSKECVGVYRSLIHGRGLFCKRNIDAGEMIIEYAGEVIRNSMTDTREKYYESKGIGCYMFRIDDTDVVDATMKGSAARFINHSCDPNCYSKVITVDNRKHIVIFAMRKILRGEELTYDYKFPIEEIKIPCTCGAKRCRRYLN